MARHSVRMWHAALAGIRLGGSAVEEGQWSYGESDVWSEARGQEMGVERLTPVLCL